MSDPNVNEHPSKAYIGPKGEYCHDPENQLLAEQAKQGKLGAQDRENRVHPFGMIGYCATHKVLGCTECA